MEANCWSWSRNPTPKKSEPAAGNQALEGFDSPLGSLMLMISDCCKELAKNLADEYETEEFDLICERVSTENRKCECGTYVQVSFSTTDDD